ncbi:Os03g0813300 [Oryza sativa Japonica Group]|uniref:Os03g0813300 protein n=1 Tax=Oryza sativa subsp. japonica TaxID=39947 RepID=A0A0P0W4J6_ORYSJ|nr:Os03g0813300 [Oryza sativa Japonica Group]
MASPEDGEEKMAGKNKHGFPLGFRFVPEDQELLDIPDDKLRGAPLDRAHDAVFHEARILDFHTAKLYGATMGLAAMPFAAGMRHAWGRLFRWRGREALRAWQLPADRRLWGDPGSVRPARAAQVDLSPHAVVGVGHVAAAAAAEEGAGGWQEKGHLDALALALAPSTSPSASPGSPPAATPSSAPRHDAHPAHGGFAHRQYPAFLTGEQERWTRGGHDTKAVSDVVDIVVAARRVGVGEDSCGAGGAAPFDDDRYVEGHVGVFKLGLFSAQSETIRVLEFYVKGVRTNWGMHEFIRIIGPDNEVFTMLFQANGESREGHLAANGGESTNQRGQASATDYYQYATSQAYAYAPSYIQPGWSQ